jgi:thiol-disulfide isomerase/thioredoxin
MRRMCAWLLVVGCAGTSKDDDDGASSGGTSSSATEPSGNDDTDDTDDTSSADDSGDGLGPCEVPDRGVSSDLDADGDGYSDTDEAHAGTDPADAADRIYIGGWPYNPEKDAITDPGWDEPAYDGATLPRFVDLDQYGQSVDIYDFANQGVPVLLDMSTEWCAPCNKVADWLGGEEDALVEYPWWREEYRCIPDLVNKGHVLWVTVLYEDGSHNNATLEVAERWHAAHPHDLIPVLVDSEKKLHGHIRATGIPNANLLTPEMVFDGFDDRGLDLVFDTLVERYLD